MTRIHLQSFRANLWKSKKIKMPPVPALLLLVAALALVSLTTASRYTGKDALRFCTRQGGTVKEYSMWNGNAPGTGGHVGVKIGSTPLVVCSFPNEEKNNVYLVALDTLVSTTPTLAVLAFQSRITPIDPVNSSAHSDRDPSTTSTSVTSDNPSSLYCAQLFGTYSADTPTAYLPVNDNVGWWTKLKSGKWYGVNDFCVFADGSAIDTWTLTYHAYNASSAGGIKFAYKP